MGLLTQTLSISAIIIGIYILGTVLLTENTPQQKVLRNAEYHLGCFLTEHNVTHSYGLESRVSELRERSKVGGGVVGARVRVGGEMGLARGNQVARAFEVFLGELARQREEMRSYVELARATKKAEEVYRNCSANGLFYKLESKKCQLVWFQYQNCSNRLGLLRQQISDLFIEKQIIQEKIRKGFNVADRSTQVPKNNQNEEQKLYKSKDKELELEQKKIESNLKIISQRLISTEYNFAVAQNQTLNSRMLYHECTEHRNQFRLCEQLSAEVRNLGYGTLEGLGDKLEKKRTSIMKIQGMLNGQTTNLNEIPDLEKLKTRSLGEYKKLHKIFAEIKIKMVKNCGCTQSQQEKLLKVVQGHAQQQQAIRSELLSLQDTEQNLLHSLNLLKQKRRLLFTEYQNRPKQKPKANIEEISMVEMLKRLELEESQVNEKVLGYEREFQGLGRDCEARRGELSGMLGVVAEISDCRAKKEYFLTLQQSLVKNKQKLNFDLNSKAKLIKSLQEFTL